MRPSRVYAVALRDMRQRVAGKRWYSLPALALALLIPAGIFPSAGKPAPDLSTPPPAVFVRGTIPPALSGLLIPGSGTRIELSGQDPLRVRTPFAPDELRKALETLPGEVKVEVRRFRADIRLPGRSILLALLAVSLLTGPLAEALPGERSRKTLEVLLSAGISRAELISGKWIAWTMVATASAFLAAATSTVAGVQAPGWWLAGLPLFIATAVALGLWLVRTVSDLVGGAAAPMRVLPVVSVGLAAAAWGLSRTHPLLAASVPLGGSLLVAGDVLPGPAAVGAAALGTVSSVAILLFWSARDLDRWEGDSAARRPGVAILVAVAALGWWLAVGGPGVWAIAGNTAVKLSSSASAAAGGAFLLLSALVAAGREGVLDFRLSKAGLAPALILGLALAAADGSFTALATANGSIPALATLDWAGPVMARMNAAIAPREQGLVVGALVIAGHTLLFRNVIQRRSGAITAIAAWTLIVCPFDPLRGVVSGLLLSFASSKWGAGAALVTHCAWALGLAVF